MPFGVQAQERVLPQSNTQVQLSFSPLVKQVAPAVVNIYTTRTVERRMNPFANDPFFGRFFQQHGFGGGPSRQQVENSLGSGVIVEADGLVVTNSHVIDGADEIKVVLSDGREFAAKLVLEDNASDLALLRMEAQSEKLPFVALKPSETLEVGDIVLAIGNPFGVGQTVTSGIVSAQGRSALNINDFNFFIQTDAAINPGNSGGPLVALDGGVVGINTAIYSRDGGSLGIGFAIPSEMVASVIAAEKAGQSGQTGVVRPWLGLTAQSVTPDIAASLGLPRPQGVLIAGLHSASPLAKAGMQVGDVITSINNREIRDPSEMKFRMATVPIGQDASIIYSHKGKAQEAKVSAVAPPDDPPRNPLSLKGRHPLDGAVIGTINPAVALEIGLDEDEEGGMAVLEVKEGTTSARFVRSGDVLLSINGMDIKTAKDAQKALDSGAGRGWALVIKRNGQAHRIFVR